MYSIHVICMYVYVVCVCVYYVNYFLSHVCIIYKLMLVHFQILHCYMLQALQR